MEIISIQIFVETRSQIVVKTVVGRHIYIKKKSLTSQKENENKKLCVRFSVLSIPKRDG
jgi:hypothetical protein